MSAIGPQMPPHLAKRKRTPDDDDDNNHGGQESGKRRASPSSFGPSRPPAATHGPSMPKPGPATHGPTMPPARSPIGPTRPPANDDEIDLDGSDGNSDVGPALPSSAAPAKTASPKPVMGPTIGPTMPSGHDDDKDNELAAAGPRQPPPPTGAPQPQKDDSDSDSSDSSDDYGPALPGAGGGSDPSKAGSPSDDIENGGYDENGLPRPPSGRAAALAAGPVQRDDWMLAPPTDVGAAAARAADPTKIRARKFASGRAANAVEARAAAGGGGGGGAAASAIGSLWTETVDQKAQRLADTVLGRAPDPRRGKKTSATTTTGPLSSSRIAHESQIQAYTEATRGRSLYEMHQAGLAGEGASEPSRKSKDRTHRSDKDDGRRHRDDDKHRHRSDREDRPGHRSDRDDDRHRHRDRQDRRHHRDRDDKHRSKKPKSADEEDDPSARAFDREKDMGLGVHINHRQRRDLVNRAGDFGGRFSKGSYL